MNSKMSFFAVGTLAVALLGGVAGGAASQMFAAQPSPLELVRDYYAGEALVKVSPHTLRMRMEKNDPNFVLVDLRSAVEYEKSHPVGAINIPGSVSGESDVARTRRLVDAFALLPKNKDVIVYCYSAYCSLATDVGRRLSENGIAVKHLAIGWQEWATGWALWNSPEEMKNLKPEDYVVSGKEPGTLKTKETLAPCSVDGKSAC